MNDREETLVRRLLANAADDLPPGEVPMQTFLAEGARAVRRRHVRFLGGAAALAVVVLLGAAVLLHVRPPAQPTPANRPPKVAPKSFDPTQRLFRLGWLPEGLNAESFRTDTESLGAGATNSGPPSPAGSVRTAPKPMTGVGVQMGARGVNIFTEQRPPQPQPHRDPPVALPWVAVAPIGGHPAYRYRSQQETTLAWQYAPDAWIAVRAFGFGDPEAVGRQVAEGLIWETHKVRMPFSPVTPPAGTTLAGTSLYVYGGRWHDAAIHYLVDGSPVRRGFSGNVSIGVTNPVAAEGGPAFPAKGRVTVGDRVGSAVDGWKGSGSYQVGEVPGCDSCAARVSPEDQAGLTAVGGRTGALDLAASIQMVDGNDDMARWRPL